MAPNLIWILADGMRVDQVNAFGGWGCPTVLDHLVRSGLRFSQAVSQSTFSPISFTAFLTALEPYHNGVSTIDGKSNRAGEIWLNQTTGIPNMLSGIHTIFDHLAALGYKNRTYSSFILGRNADYKNWGITGCNADEVPANVTAELINLLNQPQPFFMFLRYTNAGLGWVQRTHQSFVGTDYEEFMSRLSVFLEEGNQQVIKDMLNKGLHYLDETCWRPLLDTLRRAEQSGPQNTVIIFSSDHGNALWARKDVEALNASNVAHTFNLFEPTIRVPLSITGPGVPKKVIPHQVRLIDVVPTLLSLLQLPPLKHPAGIPPDGVDLTPIIFEEGETTVPEAFGNAHQSVFLRDGKYKYIRDMKSGVVTLYNILEDPEEWFDLADLHPEERFRFDNLLSLRIDGISLQEGEHFKFSVDTSRVEDELRYLGYLGNKTLNAAAKQLAQLQEAAPAVMVLYAQDKARFLETALGAVLETARLTGARVLVVDNASRDDTPQIMARYAQIPYIRFISPANQATIFNAAMDACPGRYYWFADALTIPNPQAWKSFLTFCLQGNIPAAYADLNWCDSSLEISKSESGEKDLSEADLIMKLSWAMHIQLGASLYSRDILLAVDRFKELPFGTYWDLNVRIGARQLLHFYPHGPVAKKMLLQEQKSSDITRLLRDTLTMLEHDPQFEAAFPDLHRWRKSYIYRQLFRQAMEVSDFQTAGELLQRLSHCHSFFAEVPLMEARLLDARGETQAALDILTPPVDKPFYKKKHARQWRILQGDLLLKLKRFCEALELFQGLLEQYPRYVPLYYKTAYAALQNFDAHKALQLFQTLVQFPYHPEFHSFYVSSYFNIARIHSTADRNEDAIEILRFCLQLEPGHFKAAEMLARLEGIHTHE